jgi:hypothetical protein
MLELPIQESVVILTNSYPFKAAEPLFENEAHWWSLKAGTCRVWHFPSESAPGEVHDVSTHL